MVDYESIFHDSPLNVLSYPIPILKRLFEKKYQREKEKEDMKNQDNSTKPAQLGPIYRR